MRPRSTASIVTGPVKGGLPQRQGVFSAFVGQRAVDLVLRDTSANAHRPVRPSHRAAQHRGSPWW